MDKPVFVAGYVKLLEDPNRVTAGITHCMPGHFFDKPLCSSDLKRENVGQGPMLLKACGVLLLALGFCVNAARNGLPSLQDDTTCTIPESQWLDQSNPNPS